MKTLRKALNWFLAAYPTPPYVNLSYTNWQPHIEVEGMVTAEVWDATDPDDSRNIACDWPPPPSQPNPESDELDGITDWRKEGGQ
jgi:hypothetical protein